jgi:hypothetical protein
MLPITWLRLLTLAGLLLALTLSAPPAIASCATRSMASRHGHAFSRVKRPYREWMEIFGESPVWTRTTGLSDDLELKVNSPRLADKLLTCFQFVRPSNTNEGDEYDARADVFEGLHPRPDPGTISLNFYTLKPERFNGNVMAKSVHTSTTLDTDQLGDDSPYRMVQAEYTPGIPHPVASMAPDDSNGAFDLVLRPHRTRRFIETVAYLARLAERRDRDVTIDYTPAN